MGVSYSKPDDYSSHTEYKLASRRCRMVCGRMNFWIVLGPDCSLSTKRSDVNEESLEGLVHSNFCMRRSEKAEKMVKHDMADKI